MNEGLGLAAEGSTRVCKYMGMERLGRDMILWKGGTVVLSLKQPPQEYLGRGYRWRHGRQAVHVVLVKMSQEAVSVPAQPVLVVSELGLGLSDGFKDFRFKRALVGDSFLPMVLATCLCEELAPLKDAKVKEVVVGGDHELKVFPLRLALCHRLVIHQVAKGVLTENASSKKAGGPVH